MSQIVVAPERLLGAHAQLRVARECADRARSLLALAVDGIDAWTPPGPLAQAWRELLDSLSEALVRNLADLQAMTELLGVAQTNYQAVEEAASRVAPG